MLLSYVIRLCCFFSTPESVCWHQFKEGEGSFWGRGICSSEKERRGAWTNDSYLRPGSTSPIQMMHLRDVTVCVRVCVCVCVYWKNLLLGVRAFQSSTFYSEHLELGLSQKEQPSLPTRTAGAVGNGGSSSPCFDMTVKHVKEEAALSGISSYSSAFSSLGQI